jgi:exonuclease III
VRPWGRLLTAPEFERICVWPEVGISVSRAWDLVRGALGVDSRRVVKISRIMQRDGLRRFDVFTKAVDSGFVCQKLRESAQLTGKVRLHLGYWQRAHGREARDERPAQVIAPAGDAVAKAASWNLRSILAKRQETTLYLQEQGIDVLTAQETWRYNTDWPIRLPGYRVFEAMAERGVGGALGLATCVDEKWAAYEFGKASKFCLGVKLMVGATEWSVINVYVPPKSYPTRTQALGEIRDLMVAALGNNLDSMVAIMGDWNMSKDRLVKTVRRWGLSVHLVECSGSPISHYSTRGRWRAIDHVVVSTAAGRWVGDYQVDRTMDLSDHWPLRSELRGSPIVEGEKQQVEREVSLAIPAMRRKAVEIIDDNRWAALADGMDDLTGEEALNESLRIVKDLATEHEFLKPPPTRKRKAYLLSKEAKKAITKRRRAFKVWVEGEAPSVDGPLFREYQECKEAASKSRRASVKESWAKHLKAGPQYQADGDYAKLWAWVKGLAGDTRGEAGDGPMYKSGSEGELAYSPQEKLVAWSNHFGGLLKDVTGHSRDRQYWVEKFPDPVGGIQVRGNLDDDFTWDEIDAALAKMKNGAAGFDGIPPQFYKLAREKHRMETVKVGEHEVRVPVELPERPLGKALLGLVNKVWREGSLSDSWNVAWVVSVPKKGDPKSMDNYRGISLISIIVKLVTSLVTERVQASLEERGWFIREQAGFRRGEESIAQACALYETLIRRVHSVQTTYVAFIDIKKAYDSVPIEALLRKVELAGIGGRTLRYFRAIYQNARVRVRTAYGLSDEINLERGLRQGCNASPLLFDMFINDILQGCERFGVKVAGVRRTSTGLLFADDLALTCGSADDLRGALLSISRWAEFNEMAFGVKKCGVMGVGVGGMEAVRNDPVGFRINGEAIPIVESYTYLGLEFTHDLNLDTMVKARVSIGRRTIQAMRAALGCHDIPIKIRVDTMVRALLLPRLTYGGELWGMQLRRSNMVQRVLDEALLIVARVKPGSRVTSGMAIGTELGVPPVAAIVNSARTRAYNKFPHLRTVIASLLQERDTARPWSWVTGCARWLAGQCPEAKLESGSWDANVVKSRTWWKCAQKRGVSSIRSMEVFAGTRRYTAVGGRYVNFTRGIHWLAKARAGGLWTGKSLANAKVIGQTFKVECPFCEHGTEGETLSHLLLECPKWDAQREACLGEGFVGAVGDNFLGGLDPSGGWGKEALIDHWVGKPGPEAADLLPSDFLEGMVTRDRKVPPCVRIAAFLQIVMPLRQKAILLVGEELRADAIPNGRAVLVGGWADLIADPPADNRGGGPDG